METKVALGVIDKIRPSSFEIEPEDYGYHALLVAIVANDEMSADECNRLVRGKQVVKKDFCVK